MACLYPNLDLLFPSLADCTRDTGPRKGGGKLMWDKNVQGTHQIGRVQDSPLQFKSMQPLSLYLNTHPEQRLVILHPLSSVSERIFGL